MNIVMCVSSFVVTVESTFRVISFSGCHTIQIPSSHSEHDLFQPVCVLTGLVTGIVVIYHSTYMKSSVITKQDLRINGQFMLMVCFPVTKLFRSDAVFPM
jgi:branched-subunit amino acid transport protein